MAPRIPLITKGRASPKLERLHVSRYPVLEQDRVTSPQLERDALIDFSFPSAGLPALIGFVGMEIQILHGHSSIQTAFLGRFP